MIPYELFEKTIQKIQAKEESDHKVTKLLDSMCDGYPIFGVDNGFTVAMLNLLKVGMQDMGDTISWWLYEDVEKDIWWQEDGKEVECHLETIRDLYDYLVREYPTLAMRPTVLQLLRSFALRLKTPRNSVKRILRFLKGFRSFVRLPSVIVQMYFFSTISI